MTHLETELNQLKDAMLEMMRLALSQIQKSKTALLNHDKDLAEEVIFREKRMNANELSIDRDCENIFALFNPVAVDLRFVLAILKVNTHLERIGDHAKGICKYVAQIEEPFNDKVLKEIRLEEMFDIAISMLDLTLESFETEDSDLVRRVFEKDRELNQINRAASEVIIAVSKGNKEGINDSLYLFSAIKKLERVGDLTKNIAEELIFYLEAKVLKHNKAARQK